MPRKAMQSEINATKYYMTEFMLWRKKVINKTVYVAATTFPRNGNPSQGKAIRGIVRNIWIDDELKPLVSVFPFSFSGSFIVGLDEIFEDKATALKVAQEKANNEQNPVGQD